MKSRETPCNNSSTLTTKSALSLWTPLGNRNLSRVCTRQFGIFSRILSRVLVRALIWIIWCCLSSLGCFRGYLEGNCEWKGWFRWFRHIFCFWSDWKTSWYLSTSPLPVSAHKTLRLVPASRKRPFTPGKLLQLSRCCRYYPQEFKKEKTLLKRFFQVFLEYL